MKTSSTSHVRKGLSTPALKMLSQTSKGSPPTFNSLARKSSGSTSPSTCTLLGTTSTEELVVSPSQDELMMRFFISSCLKLCLPKVRYRNEQAYRAAVGQALMKIGFRSTQIEDRNSTGISDRTVSGHGITAWIEVKYSNHARSPKTRAGEDLRNSLPTNFTSQQKKFLQDNGRVGSGHCYLWVGWWDGDRNRHRILHWSQF